MAELDYMEIHFLKNMDAELNYVSYGLIAQELERR
jgi:hypothetical protein